MDKERLKAEAEQFVNRNSGYLHSEMKDGRAPQLVMSGAFLANMWQISGMINRISELTNTSFESTVHGICGLHEMGFSNVMDAMKGEKFKFVEGHDWQEEWKDEERKKLTKEANENNMTLAFKIADLEKRNTSLNNQLVDAKKGYEKNLKAKNSEIDKLNKEILKLEHRLKEMEEVNRFGGIDAD